MEKRNLRPRAPKASLAELDIDNLSMHSEPIHRANDVVAEVELPEDEGELDALIEKEKAELEKRKKEIAVSERKERLRRIRTDKLELEKQTFQPRPPTSERQRPPRPARRNSASGSDTEINMSDLRRIKELQNLAREQTHNLAIFDKSSHSEESSDEETVKRRSKSSRKKRKSGKHDKVSSHVRFSERWPHAYLEAAQVGAEEKTYDTLSMAEFVAGFATILTLDELSVFERQNRTAHLSHLMYLAQIYEWTAVLSFHAAVLTQIERGMCKWGDTLAFSMLESRTLAGRFMKKNPAKREYTKKTAGVTGRRVFCSEYNSGKCTHADDHIGDFLGAERNMLHVCSDCLLKADKTEKHRRGDSVCPFSA